MGKDGAGLGRCLPDFVLGPSPGPLRCTGTAPAEKRASSLLLDLAGGARAFVVVLLPVAEGFLGADDDDDDGVDDDGDDACFLSFPNSKGAG